MVGNNERLLWTYRIYGTIRQSLSKISIVWLAGLIIDEDDRNLSLCYRANGRDKETGDKECCCRSSDEKPAARMKKAAAAEHAGLYSQHS